MKTAEELQKELDEANAKAEENIKALQKKLTEKDTETKATLAKIDELTKQVEEAKAGKSGEYGELVKQIGTLTEQIGRLNTDKATVELSTKYPDIVPELLLGRTPEEQEIIVNKQREVATKYYGGVPSPHAPKYKDVNEIDERIKAVKGDRTLSSEEKMVQVSELKEARASL